MEKKFLRLIFLTVIGIVSLVLATFAYAEQGDKAAGKEVFERRCKQCHGEKGEGDGRVSKNVYPPPRDFTWGLFKYKTSPGDQPPRDEDLLRTVNDGFGEASMPPWRDVMTEKEKWDVIAYEKGFSDIFDSEKPPDEIDYGKEVPFSEQSAAKGRELFLKAGCPECHGENGKGDGIKKLKDAWGTRIWARNLTKPWTYNAGSGRKNIFARITVGIPGTPMPSFADKISEKYLTDEERWHVVNYVTSIADERRRVKKEEEDKPLKARYINGEIPMDFNASEWKGAPFKALKLFPQNQAEEKFFKPTNDGITWSVLFNDNEIAFLLEWDDRTKSIPGDLDAEKLSEGDVFEDAVSVQIPATILPKIPIKEQLPSIGHGDIEFGVNIWQWKSGTTASPQITIVIYSSGVEENRIEAGHKAGLEGKGEYNGGIWKVILKRGLKTSNSKDDLQFETDKIIPIAFGNWDGSNKGKGHKHTTTQWDWLILGTNP
jgi:DMSO reductase family type II enzyme heme b subunit